jgi:flagellar protein FliJ
MAGFKFRLKAVATLREQARDRVAEALAEVHEAQRIVNEQIQQLDLEIDDARRQRHNASMGLVKVERLLLVQRQQLQLLNEEQERRRALLIEAEKEVKAMEKLEATQRLRWEEDQLVAEQKQIDEWASTQYMRLK